MQKSQCLPDTCYKDQHSQQQLMVDSHAALLLQGMCQQLEAAVCFSLWVVADASA
jgi:hypothetical protein